MAPNITAMETGGKSVSEAFLDGKRFFTANSWNPNKKDYIAFTGTQYFDTGINPTGKTTFELTLSNVVTKKNVGIFGIRSSGYYWVFQEGGGGIIQAGFINGTGNERRLTLGVSSLDSDPHVIAFEDLQLSLDGVSKGTYSASNNTVNGTALLGNIHTSATTVWTGATYDFRHLQMWEDGVLIGDFWPCLDKDGNACIADDVTQTLLYPVVGVCTAGDYS